MLEIAERMYVSWKPSFLFVVTQQGFYFGKVADIVKNKGKVGKLVHQNIPEKLQEKYLGLLKEFISNATIKA